MPEGKKKIEAKWTIDVRGLTDGGPGILNEFPDFPRRTAGKRKAGVAGEDIQFVSRPLADQGV